MSVWYWRDDRGSMQPFDMDTMSVLESVFKSHPTGTTTMVARGFQYDIDFAAMTQTNTSTGKVRSIQRKSAQESDTDSAGDDLWCFVDDEGKKVPFDIATNVVVNAAVRAGDNTVHFHFGNFAYDIDFAAMTQTNTSTGKVRQVCCQKKTMKKAATFVPMTDPRFLNAYHDEDVFEVYRHAPMRSRAMMALAMLLDDTDTATELYLPLDAIFEVMKCMLVHLASDGFTVIIKTLTGKSIPLIITEHTTTTELKSLIETKEGIPPDQQRLIFGGQQLEEMRTLSTYGVSAPAKCTIHLVLRLRGQGHMASVVESSSSLMPRKVMIDIAGVTIARVQDAVGPIHFEQQGQIVVFARPSLFAELIPNNSEEPIPVNEDVTVHIEVPATQERFNDIQMPYFSKIDPKRKQLWVEWKKVIARAVGAHSFLSVDCGVRLLSGRTHPIHTTQDLLHPAATNVLSVKCHPFEIPAAEATVRPEAVHVPELGMVYEVCVRGHVVCGKRVPHGVDTRGGSCLGVIVDTDKMPLFDLFEK